MSGARARRKGDAAAVAGYIADMTTQLESMARAAGLDLLAYVLAMARAEANAARGGAAEEGDQRPQIQGGRWSIRGADRPSPLPAKAVGCDGLCGERVGVRGGVIICFCGGHSPSPHPKPSPREWGEGTRRRCVEPANAIAVALASAPALSPQFARRARRGTAMRLSPRGFTRNRQFADRPVTVR